MDERFAVDSVTLHVGINASGTFVWASAGVEVAVDVTWSRTRPPELRSSSRISGSCRYGVRWPAPAQTRSRPFGSASTIRRAADNGALRSPSLCHQVMSVWISSNRDAPWPFEGEPFVVPAAGPLSQRLDDRDEEAALPGGVVDDGQIRLGRRRHRRPEPGQWVGHDLVARLGGDAPDLVVATLVEQPVLEGVEVDHLGRFVGFHRSAADGDRRNAHPGRVARGEVQDVRAGAAGAVDRQRVDPERVEDRHKVVRMLDERAALQAGRRAVARALGRDHAQTALEPGRSIGSEGEPAAGRPGHAQDGPPAGHPGFAPRDDPAIGPRQPMVGDVGTKVVDGRVDGHVVLPSFMYASKLRAVRPSSSTKRASSAAEKVNVVLPVRRARSAGEIPSRSDGSA